MIRRVLSLVLAVVCVAALSSIGGRAAAAAAAPDVVGTSPGGAFVATTPKRLLSESVAAGTNRRIQVSGLPAGSSAWLTVSVNAPAAAGSITVWTAGGAMPGVPTLVFAAGQSASNVIAVPLSATGAVDVRNSSGTAVQLRVDLSGHFTPGAPRSAGMFGAVTPVPVARDVSVPAMGSAVISATGSGGIPATAAIVLANLVVATPPVSGVLTAYPTGSARPPTPSVLFTAGRPQAGTGAIRVSSGGQLTLYNNSSAAVRVSVTVTGYYLAGNPTVAGSFHKVAPAQIFASAVPANGGFTTKVTGLATVPAVGVSAVVVQVSARDAAANGFLSVHAAGTTRPTTPDVVISPGRRSANLVTVPVSSTGTITIGNSSAGGVTVAGEIVGYHLGASRLTWSAPEQVNRSRFPADITALSCAGSFCMAADRGGIFYRLDGTSWTQMNAIGFDTEPTVNVNDEERIQSLSCASSTFCAAVSWADSDVAIGSGRLSTWDGTTWTARPLGEFGPRDVSCPSTTFCLATPDAVSDGWATWNGSTWTVSGDHTVLDEAIWGLSCASANLCLALGTYPQGPVSRFTGSTWVKSSDLAADHVSCASATYCLVAGSDAQGRTVSAVYTGTAWSAPVQAPAISSVSCRAASACTAVTRDGSVTRFDGTTWSTPVRLFPVAEHPWPLVSCGSTTFCAAARGNALTVSTGTTWASPVTIPNDPQPLYRVSCAGPALCMGTDNYDAVAFAPGAVRSTTELGLNLDGPGPLAAVSCGSSTLCLTTILRNYPETFRYDGSSWRNAGLVQDGADDIRFSALSCASATFCAAVGTLPHALTAAGWTRLPAPPVSLSRVSCLSATFCLATGGGDPGSAGGSSTVYNGTGWSPPVPVGDATGGAPVSLSCRSQTFCLAVDGVGRLATFTGKAWSAPVAITGAGPLVAVSCVTAGACVAVSSGAKVVQYTGAGWSAPVQIRSVGRPTDISCPNAAFCAVVDDTGKAVYGRA